MSAQNTALSRDTDPAAYMDPNAEIEKLVELGLDWADKDAAASTLEETKKALLAQLVQEVQEAARQSGGRMLSISQAETNALADPRYEDHVRRAVETRKEANRAKVRYEAARQLIDLKRTLEATRREEMRLGGYRT